MALLLQLRNGVIMDDRIVFSEDNFIVCSQFFGDGGRTEALPGWHPAGVRFEGEAWYDPSVDEWEVGDTYSTDRDGRELTEYSVENNEMLHPYRESNNIIHVMCTSLGDGSCRIDDIDMESSGLA